MTFWPFAIPAFPRRSSGSCRRQSLRTGRQTILQSFSSLDLIKLQVADRRATERDLRDRVKIMRYKHFFEPWALRKRSSLFYSPPAINFHCIAGDIKLLNG